jgi:hypothetical protein
LALQMRAGQWAELSTLGLSKAMFVDGANNTLDYLDKGGYDPVHRQVRFIGQSHGGDQRWHQYDEMTNTWSNLADPPWDGGGSAYPGFLGHGYQHNTVDPATGDFFYRQYNKLQPWWFRRSTNSWTQLPPSKTNSIAGGLEWMPSIGTQGGLVLHESTGAQRWDKATNTWTQFTGLTGAGPYHNTANHSVPFGVVLMGGGNGSNRLWKLSGTGAPVACADCPVTFGIDAAITTCDPVSGDLLVIRSSSEAYRYAVASNAWSAFSMAGAPSFTNATAGSKIIAIPMPRYGVIMFLFGGSPQVFLYKHR